MRATITASTCLYKNKADFPPCHPPPKEPESKALCHSPPLACVFRVITERGDFCTLRPRVPLPEDRNLTLSSSSSPCSSPSTPGQDLGAQWVASSPHQDQLWESHRDFLTRAAVLGTVMSPDTGCPASGSWGAQRALGALEPQATPPATTKGVLQGADAWSVFLTENRSWPCDCLFPALKSPCLYGELVN